MRIHERLDELYAIGGGVGGADRVAGTSGGVRTRAGYAVAGGGRSRCRGGQRRQPDRAQRRHERLDRLRISTPSRTEASSTVRLGVVAAIEAVERAGRGVVVVFRDEERGCIGSTAFADREQLPECFLEVHIEQGPVLERGGRPARARDGHRRDRARRAHVRRTRRVMPGRSRCWDARTPSSPPPSTSSAPAPRRSRSKARSQPSARSTSSLEP